MSLRHTPLYATHVALDARMVDFNGWEMPVQYAGIIAEHKAVRTGCGVFDVSHMGRVAMTGDSAPAFVERLMTNGFGNLRVGRARYTHLCNEDGGILDDLVIFRRAENDYLAVPNAGSYEKVVAWLQRWAKDFAEVEITSLQEQTAMLAVQGPKAVETLGSVTDVDLAGVRRFAHTTGVVAGAEAAISRTGYTGEDGFEVIMAADDVEAVWNALLEAGCTPCGLGARDTLRLEAGLLLYGSDMSESLNPLEAGLERFVDLEKDFVGADPLRAMQKRGVARRIVGLRVVERGGIPRAHQKVYVDRDNIGETTSGTFAPTLGVGIALALLPTDIDLGAMVNVDIRGRRVPAVVTQMPFYTKE